MQCWYLGNDPGVCLSYHINIDLKGNRVCKMAWKLVWHDKYQCLSDICWIWWLRFRIYFLGPHGSRLKWVFQKEGPALSVGKGVEVWETIGLAYLNFFGEKIYGPAILRMIGLITEKYNWTSLLEAKNLNIS